MSEMHDELVVEPASVTGVHGRVRPPGDKSISHRALLLASIATGRSRIRGLSNGEDVRHTMEAVQSLGAEVQRTADGLCLEGGRHRLREAESVIDVGNSGTGIRLLAGFASAIDGVTVLQGDASIARRPMDRVAVPLRLMGVGVDGRGGGNLTPLVIRGGRARGIDYTLPVPSAQVKSALLLAALGAEGPTSIHEPVASRAHTEEMLAAMGADMDVSAVGASRSVTLRPGPLQAGDIEVPTDPSQAAFWTVAACVTPGSDLLIEDVYVGSARAGFLDVLTRMGARVEVVNEDPVRQTADLRARYGPLHSTHVGGQEVPSLIDEVPVLAVAAGYAEGVTTFADAAELRVKETDRVTTTVGMLRGLGVAAEPNSDGLTVTGAGALRGGTVDSRGDHRIAMAAAVAALAAEGAVTVKGWDATTTSYPDFNRDLHRCLS